ncbi:nucleotidyl transferase AbiEii/AbiGii toxin family protein [Lactococcus lactis]|uniref:nucleotidyl transferase AbiEii/AbiGii toxin family protein n=1 Tax=Lactococcus lactis TaxID=1358 RepID=UPI00117B3400|nr:nucleotidyl transferase AbiEii/AbiGii toxin family protein [Lactococcus lactis]TRW69831.1 nucleotidyl transferase AbiEii/AbiGii toxin family protein [Lactococcus lactis]
MLSEQRVKNLIKKKMDETGLSAQQLYRLYAVEQLAKKIASIEQLRDKFILKGGYLLTTILQLANRATADLDGTIANMRLDKEGLKQFEQLISKPESNGKTYFEWLRQEETREDFLYNGFKIHLNYCIGKMKIPIKIDLTTGEDILPAQKQQIQLLFEDEKIDFKSYPIEQIMADKVITTLSYGQVDNTNSRSKDLYDIYVLKNVFPKFSLVDVVVAMNKTKLQRNLEIPAKEYGEIISRLSHSTEQESHWRKFQSQNSYARTLDFETVFEAVKTVVDDLATTEEKMLSRTKGENPKNNFEKRLRETEEKQAKFIEDNSLEKSKSAHL